ncbi:MAG: exonuclease SbcCD subunit D [Prevotellaceae bacterium]|jgi:exonuclease SbcD|nr:exonuclease SbcCD subunit D [Prevotellaceae bacterium]
MKLIHTSDWHLGHVLYGYDRSAEQSTFLHQLTDIVATEQPDVLVVSGDVYHYAAPSAATQRMYTDGMLAIRQACPTMTVVVTAGNHDSPSKLEVDSNLWRHFGVHVIGSIDLTRHIIPVTHADGTPSGYVVAVPHIYPQNFPALRPDTPRDQRPSLFFQYLLDEVTRINTQQLPVILMAHLAVGGCEMPGHDDVLGGMEYIPLAALGTGYDYLALGHIHYPQTLPGTAHRARYCGTPIPVSFDEAYPHSVTLVTLHRHGDEPQLRTIDIENPCPLLTLPAQPLPFDQAVAQLETLPNNLSAYIRLNVRSGDNYLPPDCNERAIQALCDKASRFCYIHLQREEKSAAGELPPLTIQEMQQLSPLDIARRYVREEEGTEMDDELCRLMRFAMEQISQDVHEQPASRREP